MPQCSHFGFLTVTLLVFSSGIAWAKPSEQPPNILFLFADDHSFEAIGARGLVDVDTPNLDRLYQQGTSFNRAYNMGGWNGAICVASRCMLITGRTLWDAHSIYETTAEEANAGRVWPLLLNKSGYETYFTGKWHIRANANELFDVVRHVRPGMPAQTPQGYNRPLPDGVDPWDPTDPRFGGFWEGGTHWSEVTANDAIDYLDRAADRDAPFFMYVAFNAPHDPRQSPPAFVDRYPPDRVALPENFLPEYPFKNAIGCDPKLRDEALAPFPRTEHAVKVHRGEYFALIAHMDEQIGRILDALDASGKADNTLVIFTADHGLAVGRHGFMGKQNLYEHSTRVPFVIVGPGIAAGVQQDKPIYLQDIMPTTLELAGIPVPDHVGFTSLLPQLQNESSPPPYQEIYGAYMDFQRSITRDGYSLILYPNAQIARLYNLREDPHQLHDLASSPDHTNVLNALYTALLRQQHTLGDPLDLTATFGTSLARHP
ncbi:sulfatase-like hydrolase/transferase [Tautonia rosea]|uniref:sulfatase-like hydrolase/transferase n=1 Tax=Tautonia rosea TaxID=2728037 RepID=UPI0019D0B2F9|nr:sulfatase-like hydrolase/transferase [Tautonia rosea]